MVLVLVVLEMSMFSMGNVFVWMDSDGLQLAVRNAVRLPSLMLAKKNASVSGTTREMGSSVY